MTEEVTQQSSEDVVSADTPQAESATAENTTPQEEDLNVREDDNTPEEPTGEMPEAKGNVTEALRQEREKSRELKAQIEWWKAQANPIQSQPEYQQPVATDEDGYIDANKFRQDVIREAQMTAQAQIREELSWKSALDRYPELKDDGTRAIVEAVKLRALQSGNYLTPEQAADAVFAQFAASEKKGEQRAHERKTIQQAASLSEARSPESEPSTDDERQKLMKQMSQSNDPNIRFKLAQELLKLQ